MIILIILVWLWLTNRLVSYSATPSIGSCVRLPKSIDISSSNQSASCLCHNHSAVPVACFRCRLLLSVVDCIRRHVQCFAKSLQQVFLWVKSHPYSYQGCFHSTLLHKVKRCMVSTHAGSDNMISNRDLRECISLLEFPPQPSQRDDNLCK